MHAEQAQRSQDLSWSCQTCQWSSSGAEDPWHICWCYPLTAQREDDLDGTLRDATHGGVRHVDHLTRIPPLLGVGPDGDGAADAVPRRRRAIRGRAGQRQRHRGRGRRHVLVRQQRSAQGRTPLQQRPEQPQSLEVGKGIEKRCQLAGIPPVALWLPASYGQQWPDARGWRCRLRQLHSPDRRCGRKLRAAARGICGGLLHQVDDGALLQAVVLERQGRAVWHGGVAQGGGDAAAASAPGLTSYVFQLSAGVDEALAVHGHVHRCLDGGLQLSHRRGRFQIQISGIAGEGPH
mmetsp:Transcript_96237/g.305350  ORF Transcript_96237/g.305350 Transcript_96237/m.305350 type:complete len:292 (+) Transcript_96237:65-940(+)